MNESLRERKWERGRERSSHPTKLLGYGGRREMNTKRRSAISTWVRRRKKKTSPK